MGENKRFYIEDNGIWDNTWKRRKPLTWKELCDTLNKFQELTIKDLKLIEQLKKENEKLKSKLFDCQLELEHSKESVDDAYWELTEIKKENEELKQSIADWILKI